jgi:hypothetical protein
MKESKKMDNREIVKAMNQIEVLLAGVEAKMAEHGVLAVPQGEVKHLVNNARQIALGVRALCMTFPKEGSIDDGVDA